jgi:hypothetical protein
LLAKKDVLQKAQAFKSLGFWLVFGKLKKIFHKIQLI